MRRRESGSANILDAAKANDYFNEVYVKMNKLREVLERKDTDQTHTTHTGKYTYFNNSNKIIDFILVYDKQSKPIAKSKVNEFLKNLVNKGFSTEGHDSENYPDLIFIKVHCPRAKLVRAGVILDMNLAFLRANDPISDYNLFFNLEFLFNDITKPHERSDAAQRAHESTFNMKPKDITTAERIMVTYELLNNTRYGSNDDECGVMSLLGKKYLHACYPLHDGKWDWSERGPLNDRQLLFKFWASCTNTCKLQPLDLVRKYFGTEVAFYFAFMAFLNKMLIVPSIVGVISVLYGVLTFKDFRNYRSLEICASEIVMCPPCNDRTLCDYEPLRNGCVTSQVSYIFDNLLTTVYSAMWCLWSSLIYAKWKQREAVLMYKWDLMDLEREVTIRPQYLVRALNNKKNVTKTKNAGKADVFLSEENQFYESRGWRFIRYSASGIMIFLVVMLLCLAFLMDVSIRFMLGRLIGRFEGQFSLDWHSIALPTMGNLFVLLFVCISEDLYIILARFVTDFENPRTQEEYEESYIYKYSALCFMTSYSFIIYTAFIKGRLQTWPGDPLQYTLFQYDIEKIHPAFLTVSYQWTFLTVGKEVWHQIRNQFRHRNIRKNLKRRLAKAWESEYPLYRHDFSILLDENMKIVLQYGYLVLFPGAMPLGPLGYFLYNLWLMRFEARKLLIHTRRVMPVRSHGLGPWLKMIKMLTIMGMCTNVFFIAFTSNFVGELNQMVNPYYQNVIDSTFSVFAVDDYPKSFGPEIRKGFEGKICYYKGRRLPPTSRRKYELNIDYWNFLSVRFLTVIVVQSIVIILSGLLVFWFGGIPHFIKESIKHRINMKQEKREEKFRRERPNKQSTTAFHEDLHKSFKIIDY